MITIPRALSRVVLALVVSCDATPESAPEQDGGANVGDVPAHAGRYVTGAACSTSVDCPGGECARGPAQIEGEPGYCTVACTKQSECESTALCAVTGVDRERRCLAACVAQSECRDGFRCVGGGQLAGIAVPGACRPLAATDSLAAGVAGRGCASDADCEGGRCAERSPVGLSYPGRYCSGRCYENSACGVGGVCLLPAKSVEPGHCLRGCDVDVDCGRDGYRCLTFGDGERLTRACMPGAPRLPDGVVGQPCATDGECAGGAASCASAVSLAAFGDPAELPTQGGYCTQSCFLDEDCGADGQCITSGVNGGRCLSNCDDARPCRDGYECIAHLRDGDPAAQVCIPRRF